MTDKSKSIRNEERSLGSTTSTNLPKPKDPNIANGSLGGKTKTEVNTTGKKGK